MQRISELVSTRAALERELATCVNEYSRRRVALVSAGKPIEGSLREQIAPSPNFQQNQIRREQIAHQGYEHEQSLMDDPLTRTLLTKGT